MLSGGGSVSVICAAITFTVQVVPAGRFEDGVRVMVVAGDALWLNVFGVPTGHSSENALAVALTLSLKVTEIVEFTATFVAAEAGVVLMTEGALSPAPLAVTEKSSIAIAWSLSGWFMSTQRSQTSCPLAIVREIVADFWARFAAALPSSVAAAVVPNVGLAKSRGS